MIKRNIIKIDEEKCNGCGICVEACHEGALQLIDGKAKLVSESYCDGLGDCLPACPVGAIIIEERVAKAFDEETVKKIMGSRKNANNVSLKIDNNSDLQNEFDIENITHEDFCDSDSSCNDDCDYSDIESPLACGCPGSQSRAIEKKNISEDTPSLKKEDFLSDVSKSELRQWPVQINLVPINAPYLKNANLLVAADCTAYAYANIHRDFMRNRITVIGCPKLDDTNYASKLTEILKANTIKSITVLRMDVPCCGGIVRSVKEALLNSGKMIPWSITTISTDGEILENN